jgi:L-asparaginase II
VPDVIVAEVVRSGFVESCHWGSAVAVDAAGDVILSAGDVSKPVFPRSSNKPLQAAAMVSAGLPLRGRLLALACASHSGEPFHLDGVREMLATAGLSESVLQTPPDWPLDETARIAAIRDGADPSALAMNCSGKHAAMLLTSAANGWDLDSYRRPSAPVQVAIGEGFERLTGEPVAAVGVDGCGAPLLATSLTGLARAFSRLRLAPAGTAEHAVAEAITGFPTYVSGSRRDEALLLQAMPGVIAKAGAEGSYALALPDGVAVALKIADGAARARPVVMAQVLRLLGHDHAVLDQVATVPVFGHCHPVGEIRGVVDRQLAS